VLVNQGQVIGMGHTQQAGGPHAEVMALRDATSAGHALQGATAYVTLEPCSHQGRTGPCCDALIQAGVRKVVATQTDPNPLVAGRGFDRMRAAGIEVEVLPSDHPLAIESRELNIGFFSRMVRKTPWVRMKTAASVDGITALPNGVSQWITSPDARTDGHAWRARACAVLTGIGTVQADNPRLDVRLVPSTRQPHLVIVDSALRTPVDAALFDIERRVVIYTAVDDISRHSALQARGATVVALAGPPHPSTGVRKVDLAAMLRDLAQREVNELHLEAGHALNGSFLREGLVDELLIYLAPKLLGQGAGIAQWGPLEALDAGTQLQFASVQPIGPDLRILARVTGRDIF
jgi:diaminohydroxyphosphoribosylaminopyrimidine deaminase/5-amino-6-(5-phosphoribosylamino)uracil reductase